MPSDPPPRLPILYFCDESSFIGDKFMAVGGLGLKRSRAVEICNDLYVLRERHRARGEIKWQNARKRGLGIRKAYIDYLVGLIAKNYAHLHIRFSPIDEYDHDGDRHIFDTVSKSFYQLFLHRALRYYGSTCQITIKPDNGECTRLLPGLKEALLVDGQLRYKTHPNCIEGIIPIDSKAEPLLHLLDVTCGALTAYRNDRHLSDKTGAPKKELAEYAFKAFKLRSIVGNRDDGCKFSIWNVIPKRRRRGPKG